MSLNRTAKGIVLVPSLLLGGAFLAAASWLEGPAAQNRGLALALGGVLLATGLLAQLLPEPERPTSDPEAEPAPPQTAGERPAGPSGRDSGRLGG